MNRPNHLKPYPLYKCTCTVAARTVDRFFAVVRILPPRPAHMRTQTIHRASSFIDFSLLIRSTELRSFTDHFKTEILALPHIPPSLTAHVCTLTTMRARVCVYVPVSVSVCTRLCNITFGWIWLDETLVYAHNLRNYKHVFTVNNALSKVNRKLYAYTIPYTPVNRLMYESNGSHGKTNYYNMKTYNHMYT